jgi:hypothetical protein
MNHVDDVYCRASPRYSFELTILELSQFALMKTVFRKASHEEVGWTEFPGAGNMHWLSIQHIFEYENSYWAKTTFN